MQSSQDDQTQPDIASCSEDTLCLGVRHVPKKKLPVIFRILWLKGSAWGCGGAGQ